MNQKLIIIGGGLTGLALGYFLKKEGIKAQIIEGRSRLGGRIHTINNDQEYAPIELGATWLGEKHIALFQLLSELEIPAFEQQLGEQAFYEPISTSPAQLVQLPHNDDPSYRISGGTTRIIHALKDRLDLDQISMSECVLSIREQGNQLLVITTKNEYLTDKVVTTLPPNLLISSIKFEPELPHELTEVAKSTHTWMGESIKIALRFKTPFWRKKDSSGTIFSNVGPISELYDHSNVEDNLHALKGFLNSAYYSVTREERLAMVLAQLRKYYGSAIDDYHSYEEAVWRDEPLTFNPYESHILPHQNNGHPSLQQSYMSDRLIIAGAETATAHAGYMDGAVRSAFYTANKILQQY